MKPNLKETISVLQTAVPVLKQGYSITNLSLYIEAAIDELTRYEIFNDLEIPPWLELLVEQLSINEQDENYPVDEVSLEQLRFLVEACFEKNQLQADNKRLYISDSERKELLDRYDTLLSEASELKDCRKLMRRAQERVLELENGLEQCVRALHEHGHKQEASVYYKLLPGNRSRE